MHPASRTGIIGGHGWRDIMRLEHKGAIVTGAASGFGEGIARRFAAEGCKIAVNDIDAERGERVAREISAAGGEALFIHADVSRNADVERLVNSTLETFGRLHIVVNNAGTTHRKRPMLEVTEGELGRVYAVNVKSRVL